MDLLLVILLLAVLAAVGVLLVVLTRRTAAPDLAGAVQQATARAVAEAIASVNEQIIKGQATAQENAASLVATMGSQEFGKQAKAIDTRLDAVVGNLASRIGDLDARLRELGEFNASQYSAVQEAVTLLSKRTENLNEILSNSQKRGQWGERLAEDMLRAVGLKLGINYRKQATDESGGRPDYTFLMPPNRVLLMDVKFPLDKYAEYVNATTDGDRTRTQKEFVKAVKFHVDSLSKREYTEKGEAAIDYVLMFIPNEGISGFVHDSDPDLIDYALGKKVVLCSPLTLYAFLVVVRQATDSFHTEQAAASIMQEINKFSSEWKKYVEAVDEVRKQFGKMTEQLDVIGTGGTRFKKLNVPVKAIEKMRTAQGIPELPMGPARDDGPDDAVEDDAE